MRAIIVNIKVSLFLLCYDLLHLILFNQFGGALNSETKINRKKPTFKESGGIPMYSQVPNSKRLWSPEKKKKCCKINTLNPVIPVIQNEMNRDVFVSK